MILNKRLEGLLTGTKSSKNPNTVRSLTLELVSRFIKSNLDIFGNEKSRKDCIIDSGLEYKV